MSTAMVIAILGLGACGTTTEPPPAASAEPGIIEDVGEPFMKVDGFVVGRNEMDQAFRNKGVPEPMLSNVATSPGGYHIIEDYAVATALYRKALEEDLQHNPQVQLALAFGERQALSRAMQRVLIERELTDERVDGWIAGNRDRFAMPQRRGREIVVSTEAKARELMERIEKGENFARLAADHSIDKRSAPNGGYIGWFSIQDRPDLGEALFAHSAEQVLGPLQSAAGWHIVEIMGSRDATPPDEQKAIARMALEQSVLREVLKKVRDSIDLDILIEGVGDEPPAEAGMEAAAPPDAAEE